MARYPNGTVPNCPRPVVQGARREGRKEEGEGERDELVVRHSRHMLLVTRFTRVSAIVSSIDGRNDAV